VDPAGAPLDGKSVWRGREEYVEFTRTWTDQFHDWSIRAERLIDAGDDQVVVVTTRRRPAGRVA
jgi:hypothetical protein